MRASVICVGRLSREYQAVWRHYEGLLRPYLTLEVFEAPEVPLSLGEARAREKEGTVLLALLRKGAFTIAVDGRGRQYSSEAWSAFLGEKKVGGHSHFQFVLGGAVGLDERVLAAAQVTWALSDLTFPHQMARCIVAEQLYRALRIERGEPYHH
ncbi:MAG: 23S rRNA (pseudouridine(1915)-N(3))-methyltransferase RlmH [Thermoleophilia bacterium]|nr:23S rRNA (pseudouridine(1915)-N(3))-methyltransferase RlmH [Thermoleophilia bacterium]